MSKSKTLRLVIAAKGEVLAVLMKERHPNQFGEITPPVVVEHDGVEYILKRQMMQDVYVYDLSDRRKVDDFLATNE